MRINISMNEDLVKKIDELAEQMHISRSAYISVSVFQKMQQDEAISNMPKVIEAVKEAVLLDQKRMN